jgi:hypothetical protein
MSTAARIAEDSLSSSLTVFVVSNLLLEPLNLLLLPCGEAESPPLPVSKSIVYKHQVSVKVQIGLEQTSVLEHQLNPTITAL